MKIKITPIQHIASLAVTAALLSGITPNLHAAGLTASDGAASDWFGRSASVSGNTGLVGALQDDDNGSNSGSVYLFRDLDTATGTITQNVKLKALDGASNDGFGGSVSISGDNGLVGAQGDNAAQGSAYLFRNLNTASGTITQNVKLTASDGASLHSFGNSLSLSGNTGVVGAAEQFHNTGAAYLFRNLNTATDGSSITQNVKLLASDNAAGDTFGGSVSVSGTIALIGALTDDIAANLNQGSAYVFRNLDTAIESSTINQNVKLTASDGAAEHWFGSSVSLSGTVGLVGAFYSNSVAGSAYLFRNLNTATGTITQNVILSATDAAANDDFGNSVSLSGNTGLVGARGDDDKGINSGSAYLFLDLNAAGATKTQNVKLTASDGTSSDSFGRSVSADGDNFLIGAHFGDGVVATSGKAYSGSVSSVTTLDAGNASRTISGISFVSQDDWIIGQTTDSNQVTLSAGDGADVTATGKVTHIGQNAGSDNNTLLIDGTLVTNEVKIGAAGNTGNLLTIDGSLTATSGVTVAAGSAIGGDGTLTGNLSFLSGGKFVFSLTGTLTVTGSVAIDTTFGIDDVIGLDSSVALGTYTLINGTATDFSSLGIENWGSGNAYDLGSGKSAYFKQGSLQVEVVPEPGTLSLLALGLSAFALRRRRS